MSLDTAELVVRSRKGDSGAFGCLVNRYQTPLFNGALRIVGNWDDALDVTQTVFLKVYEKLDTYDDSYRFFSWVYRIMINESLNLVRRRKSHGPLDDTIACKDKSPDQRCYESEIQEQVDRAIMRLPVEYRVVIVLRHFARFSYREIGFALELPGETVKSRLYTARRTLGAMLEKQE